MNAVKLEPKPAPASSWRTCADCGASTPPNRVRCPECVAAILAGTIRRHRRLLLHGPRPSRAFTPRYRVRLTEAGRGLDLEPLEPANAPLTTASEAALQAAHKAGQVILPRRWCAALVD